MPKKPTFRLPARGLMIFLFVSLFFAQQESTKKPIAKIIPLDSRGKDYLRVLGGPPETSTMRSGLVTLDPMKSVGKHSTENYEELVIILDGLAEIQITGGRTLRLAKGFAAYCPPHTEHDVLNIGNDALRYIYVVAKARE